MGEWGRSRLPRRCRIVCAVCSSGARRPCATSVSRAPLCRLELPPTGPPRQVSWPYNTVTDGENVTQEALANILGIWDYLKNSGDHPESANMGLNWVGNVGCKREGRRFVGQYVQSQNDVMRVDRLCSRKPPYCPAKPAHAPPPGPAQEPELYWDRVACAGWGATHSKAIWGKSDDGF